MQSFPSGPDTFYQFSIAKKLFCSVQKHIIIKEFFDFPYEINRIKNLTMCSNLNTHNITILNLTNIYFLLPLTISQYYQ